MAGPKPTPLAERFARYVVKDDPSGCWLWSGALRNGYGQIRAERGRRVIRAHRVAWEFAHGPIPDGLFVCHACNTPRCVRPEHLFLGTPRENMHDMIAKRRDRFTGTRHSAARFTDDQIRAIRSSSDSSYVEARRYGVAANTIRCIRLRKRWQHVT